MDLLRIADGLQVGETTIYGTADLPEQNADSTFTWMLPGFVVIGRTGADRALVVHEASDGVLEVPDSPWDGSRLELSADDPLDLVLRHQGAPLAERRPDWAWPGVDGVIQHVCDRYLERGALLTRDDLLYRSGSDVPETMIDRLTLVPVDAARAAELLRSAGLEDAMNNPRPQPADLGPTSRQAYERACDQIADLMREPVRALAQSATPAVAAPGGEAALVRDVLATCVLASAFEQLAAQTPGAGEFHRPWTDLLTVAEAGYLPLGVTAGGELLLL